MCIHLPKVELEEEPEYADGPLSSVMMFVATVGLAILGAIALIAIVR